MVSIEMLAISKLNDISLAGVCRRVLRILLFYLCLGISGGIGVLVWCTEPLAIIVAGILTVFLGFVYGLIYLMYKVMDVLSPRPEWPTATVDSDVVVVYRKQRLEETAHDRAVDREFIRDRTGNAPTYLDRPTIRKAAWASGITHGFLGFLLSFILFGATVFTGFERLELIAIAVAGFPLAFIFVGVLTGALAGSLFKLAVRPHAPEPSPPEPSSPKTAALQIGAGS